MEGAPTGGVDLHHGERERDREGEPQSLTESLAAPPGIAGLHAQPKSTLQPESHPTLLAGITNPGFMEDPPPYSPPDPKTVHLIYPAFQGNVSRQGSIFFQPTTLQPALNPQPHPFPGSYPFTIVCNYPRTEPGLLAASFLVNDCLVGPHTAYGPPGKKQL